jgi:hypothetical protein
MVNRRALGWRDLSYGGSCSCCSSISSSGSVASLCLVEAELPDGGNYKADTGYSANDDAGNGASGESLFVFGESSRAG